MPAFNDVIIFLMLEVMLNFKVFEDAACARELLDWHVKCASNGCGWSGELRNVEVKYLEENHID